MPWSENAALLGVRITYLTVIPLTARRWSPRPVTMLRGEATTLREEIQSPVLGFLVIVGGLVFFFGLLSSVWCPIAYVAGIFAVTARGSKIAPTTLVYGAGAGVAAGLIVYAAAWPGRGFLDSNPLLPLVLIVVPPAMMLSASAEGEQPRPHPQTAAWAQQPSASRHGAQGCCAGTPPAAPPALELSTALTPERVSARAPVGSAAAAWAPHADPALTNATASRSHAH